MPPLIISFPRSRVGTQLGDALRRVRPPGRKRDGSRSVRTCVPTQQRGNESVYGLRMEGAFMAEDKMDGREATWRQLLPWTELFRGFQVAFDLNKMLLAAAGILVMAFGWWLLAVCFRNMPRDLTDVPPDWPAKYQVQEEPRKAWEHFKR